MMELQFTKDQELRKVPEPELSAARTAREAEYSRYLK
jgi:hypothetical protein